MIWLGAILLLIFAVGALVLAFVLSRSRVPGAAPAEQSAAVPRSVAADFFRRLTRELRARVRGLDPRYDVPWIALIGPEGAGKSMLLGTAEGPTAEAGPMDGALRPYFLSGGVAIEIGGTLAFPSGGALDAWRATLQRVRQERPRRPLDGIVVAVSAELFVDDSTASWRDTLAALLRARLQEMQAELGFVLPVYVLVTKADLLPGFREFAAAIPQAQRQNVLGWSSSYRPDLPFDPAWIDEAFAETYRGLVRAQMEMYGGADVPAAPDRVFLFPSELARLRAALKPFLAKTLRPSAYEPQPIFRGIYFTGSAAAAAEPLFARDLFEQKIFAERGLGVPLGSALTARNRQSRWAQAIAAVLAVGLTAGTWLESGRLRELAGTHARFLDTLSDAQNDASLGLASQSAKLDQGYRLAQSMSQLRSEGFRSWWLPASQIAPVEPEIAAWFRRAFEVILADFRVALRERGKTLAERNAAEGGGHGEGLDAVPEYVEVRELGAAYRRFTDNLSTYNALATRNGGTLGQFNRLASYLTRGSGYAAIDLPAEPYASALRQTRAERLDCSGLNLDARARQALDRFAGAWFRESNPVLTALDEFLDEWNALSKSPATADIGALKRKLDVLAQQAQAFRFLGSEFQVTDYPALAAAPFSHDERYLAFCPVDLSDKLGDLHREHDGLRATLVGRTYPGVAEPVVESEMEQLTLGGRTQLVRGALNEIANLGFITVGERPAIIDPARAVWDTAQLDEALAALERFEQFRLPALDRTTEDLLRRGIREQLATRVWWAARPGASAVEGPDGDEALIGVLDRFRKAAPALRRSQSGAQLYGAVTNASERVFLRWRAEVEGQYRDLAGASSGDRSNTLALRSVEQWFNLRAQPDRLNRWNDFVDGERDDLLKLVRSHAPLIRFLSETRPRLVERWRALSAEVERYDAKAPQNGIAALETALRAEMPAVAPEKGCLDTSPKPNVKEPLLTVRNRLMDEAINRCRQLVGSTLAERYAAIRAAYNQYLNNRFPYSRPGQAAMSDVTAPNLAEFYRIYQAQNGPGLAAELPTCQSEIAGFVRHFDLARPLYAPTLDQGLPFATVDLQPEFRVHREAEQGGHHIAEWSFSSGGLVTRMGDAPKPVRWTAGAPVSFRFRFAKDSPLDPQDGHVAGMRAVGKQVEFTYTGAWSVLAAIVRQRASDGELPGLQDTEPYSLGFTIPVNGDERVKQVRVFVRLRLIGAGKKDEIRVPAFPFAAPDYKPCDGGKQS